MAHATVEKARLQGPQTATATASSGPPARMVLRPGTAVLLRPDRSIQFGIHPGNAVVLPVPAAVDPGQVLQVMMQARAGMTPEDLAATLGYCGFTSVEAGSIAEELSRAGVLVATREQAIPLLRFGKPSLSLADALFTHGVKVDWLEAPRTTSEARSGQVITSQGRTARRDVLILPGGLFPPPDVQFWLHEKLIPHYPTGVIDGCLAFGPLIIPGHTACLSCIDQAYLERDALWRSTRAQATARPVSYTTAEHGLLAQITTQIIREHIIPWRDAGSDPAAIPPLLTQRQFFDTAGFAIQPEEVRREPECVLCRMAEAGRGLDVAR